MRYLLILLLLTGCKDVLFGDDHLSSGQDVLFVSGYESASIDNTIYYIKDYKDLKSGEENPTFSMGNACKMWAGLIPKNNTLTETGFPINNHHFRLKLILKSIEETNKDCANLSGVKNAKACTEHMDNGCRVHLSPDQTDDIWGWECAACFTKEFT